MLTKSPRPEDGAVGGRVRSLRQLRRMSQEALASRIGVTFQQVQKYEKGVNRIGAGRLIEIARILEVTVADLVGETEAATALAEMHQWTRAQLRAAEMIGRLPPDVADEAVGILRSLVEIFERRDDPASLLPRAAE